MDNVELRDAIALAISKGMAEAFYATPAQGREFDPDSWTAVGGTLDLSALVDKWVMPVLRAQPEAKDAWRLDMDNAPRDGTVINAVARYPEATAGFPTYISWDGNKWTENGFGYVKEMIPWAWRERDNWPMETAPATDREGGEAELYAEYIRQASDLIEDMKRRLRPNELPESKLGAWETSYHRFCQRQQKERQEK